MGTWQDLAVMKASDLVTIPQDCMPPECAALSQQLCLAYCLLEQFGKLKVSHCLTDNTLRGLEACTDPASLIWLSNLVEASSSVMIREQ